VSFIHHLGSECQACVHISFKCVLHEFGDVKTTRVIWSEIHVFRGKSKIFSAEVR
jgi:hypothetical protein